METYTCQHCLLTLSTQNLLDKHQTTNKLCSKKKVKNFKCIDCNNEFSAKQSLANHILICKIAKVNLLLEKDNQIVSLKNVLIEKQNENLILKNVLLEKDIEIKHILNVKDTELKNVLHEKYIEIKNVLSEKNDELTEYKNKVIELQAKLEIYKDSQDCLKEIAKQPKTTKNIQNNSINNKYVYLTPLNLTQEIIKQKIQDNFTEKHLIEGQKGVAIFTHDNLLLDENNNLKYLCGDTSRNYFYYKNSDGTIEKDPKATNLTKMIAEDVIAKSHHMVMEILDDDTIELLQKLDYQNIFYDIKHLRNDNGKFISNLSLLTSKKLNTIK